MDKKSSIWIIIICILIVLLAGSAIRIGQRTRQITSEEEDNLERAKQLGASYEGMLKDSSEGMRPAPAADSEKSGGKKADRLTQESPEEKTEESEEDMSERKVIFVGDSRTVGMGWAEEETGDRCVYIGESGEGLRWFEEEGYDEMADAIRKAPNLPVVFNLGVNDVPDEYAIGHYLEEYAEVEEAFPDTVFYYMSVNPVNEDMEEAVTDDMITSFNAQIKAAYPDTYIDTYTWMKKEGFETIDGIHYTQEQYRAIHDYALRQIFG